MVLASSTWGMCLSLGLGWQDEAKAFTDFLARLIPALDDLEDFERLSREFGAHHADLKSRPPPLAFPGPK